VARRTISSTLEGTGTVQPVNSYTVKALVTGDVLSAPFEEGDIIEAGKLLFQCRPLYKEPKDKVQLRPYLHKHHPHF